MKFINFLIDLVVVSLFLFNIIPQKYHVMGFSFHNGGDDVTYFKLAQSFAQGNPFGCGCSIGYSLTLAPILKLMPNMSHDDFLVAVSFITSIGLFPLGQILLFEISKKMTGSTETGSVVVLFWTLLPIVTFLLLKFIIHDPNAGDISSHLIWAQMLTEGITTMVSLLALNLFLDLHKKQTISNIILFGAMSGYIFLLRITGVVAIVVFALIFIKSKKWKQLLIFLTSAFVIVLPQLIYNYTFFGSPLTSGYVVNNRLESGLFSAKYLLDALIKTWTRFGPLVLVVIPITVMIFWSSLIKLKRYCQDGALVIFLWTIGTVAIYSLYYYTYTGDYVRFMIPILPFLSLIFISGIPYENIINRLRSRAI
ncbi:MAG: hypothetical protein M1484_00600 [Patescibacteria group bacterium]|nr:hypothetical protein [Patescibacteria group bacterium]MCL5431580.1 hypothetical protein [Patescibacteria group bacterium]